MSTNGLLPASELVLVPNNDDITTYGNQYVATAVLPYLLAAAAEFRQRTGEKLYLKEAYRPLATQVDYFLARYHIVSSGGVVYDGRHYAKNPGAATAALPGTSIHGLGDAIDIWSGIDTSFTSPHHKVWVEVATMYGWLNTGTGFGEPWHQEWSAVRVTERVAIAVAYIHPDDSAGAAVVDSPTPSQEESMTTLITSPAGQTLVVPGIGTVEMSPNDVTNLKGVGGPEIQTVSVTAALHQRILARSQENRDQRVMFLVQGSGYVLLEARKLSVIGSMDTVNVLTAAGVATVPISTDQFNALSKDFR